MALAHDLPAFPIVLGHRVLDGDDGILFHPADHERGELLGGEAALFEAELVKTVVIQIGGGDVERDADFAARRVAG
jgi:hypothetical protein